jgi:hypothetical protein
MTKFRVTLGRLVRESASIVVSAKSKKDLEARLHEVYEAYDGDWSPDVEWGCNESDCHTVDGGAPKRAKVDVTLKGV